MEIEEQHEDSSVRSDDSDREDYKKIKSEIKNKDKKKKNLGEIIGNLLNKKSSKKYF